jgi:hypothetical protein
MKNFKWFVCALVLAVITCGFAFQELKPLAEDLPYLDGVLKLAEDLPYLDGVTKLAEDLPYLDGISKLAEDLPYLDGITVKPESIHVQL